MSLSALCARSLETYALTLGPLKIRWATIINNVRAKHFKRNSGTKDISHRPNVPNIEQVIDDILPTAPLLRI